MTVLIVVLTELSMCCTTELSELSMLTSPATEIDESESRLPESRVTLMPM
jgi:hypothetical protein